jgi:thiamine biosynthesis protein ThiI
VLALLSGGIDSPVAAWMMMKRGCRVDLVHFDSRPPTGPQVVEKVHAGPRLAACSRASGCGWCPSPTSAGAQGAGRDSTHVLYRRSCCASPSASPKDARQGAGGRRQPGQVASQTLKNLALVEAAARRPAPAAAAALFRQRRRWRWPGIGTHDVDPSYGCTLSSRAPVTAWLPEVATSWRPPSTSKVVTAAAERATCERSLADDTAPPPRHDIKAVAAPVRLGGRAVPERCSRCAGYLVDDG